RLPNLEPRFRVTGRNGTGGGPTRTPRPWARRFGWRVSFAISGTADEDALLADEIRARRVLDRRPRRRAEPHDRVVRRAQLPGAQLHARRDARRRPRVLLSLELRRARRRRHRRDLEVRVSGRDAVRSEEPVLRSEVDARRATVAACRREARAQDEARHAADAA